MGVTDINYDKLLRWMLPVRLSLAKTLAWVFSFSRPIYATDYPKFKTWKAKCWHDLKYQSGQVAYLEYVLNERFDPTQHRIYIGPGQNVSHYVYLYLDSENQPVPLYLDVENEPLYLYTDAELASSGGGYDFTINVPTVLGVNETELKALANRYKRDGKKYVIVYF